MTATKNNNTWNFLAALAIAGMILFAFFFSGGPFSGKTNGMSGYVLATVSYSDGTHNSYTLPTNPTNTGGQALTIVTSGGSGPSVTSVTFSMYVTPVFTGTVSSWTVNSVYYYEICPPIASGSVVPNVNSPLYESAPSPLSFTGMSLTSGLATLIQSFPMQMTTLQRLYSGWKVGANYWWVIGFAQNLTMTINFADGTSLTRSANIACPAWSFQWQSANTFSSLSVNTIPSVT